MLAVCARVCVACQRWVHAAKDNIVTVDIKYGPMLLGATLLTPL